MTYTCTNFKIDEYEALKICITDIELITIQKIASSTYEYRRISNENHRKAQKLAAPDYISHVILQWHRDEIVK